MKHLNILIYMISMVMGPLFLPSKGLAQNPLPNSSLPSDSIVVLDKNAQQIADFEALPASLKYSEIIIRPDIYYNLTRNIVEKVNKKGGHDLLFSVQEANSIQSQINTDVGIAKNYRPIWVLIVVGFLFLILGIIRIIFPVELKIIVDAYYKERLLLQVSKEDSLATSWPYIFLYILFSFSLGLFVVVAVSSFSDKNFLSFENFLKNSAFVAVLFIAKVLLIRFISFIFSLDKIVREYIAILYLIYFNSMFFLMPFLLALLFVPVSYFKVVTILYVVGVTILFLYRFIRTAFHLFAHFKFSIFYLILYLCSLELAPILILVRSLSN